MNTINMMDYYELIVRDVKKGNPRECKLKENKG